MPFNGMTEYVQDKVGAHRDSLLELRCGLGGMILSAWFRSMWDDASPSLASKSVG